MTTTALLSRPRNAFWLVPALGAAWNVFGISRFASTAMAGPDGLIAMGMTPEQASLYAGLPVWMTLAFAVGVFGGLLGCILLLLRRKPAVPVLAISLASYAVLFAGDIALGVFAAFGAQQVAILTAVVLIAMGLLAFALKASKGGALS